MENRLHTLDRPVDPLENLWIAFERVVPLPNEVYPYLRLEGGINEKLLKESYLKTLDAFPYLKGKVVFDNKKRIYWSVDSKVPEGCFKLIKIEEGEEEFKQIYQEIINHPRFDLSRQPGVKLYLVKGSDKTDFIVFRYSHVLMDWGGGISFLEELCQCYNSLIQGEEPVFSLAEEHPYDDFLTQKAKEVNFRHFLKFLALAFDRFNPSSLKKVAYLAKYGDQQRVGEYHFCDWELGENEFDILKKKAKARGMTVNDLVLAATYRMVEDWCLTRKIPYGCLNLGSGMDYRQFTNKSTLKNFSIPRIIKLFPKKIGDDEELIHTLQSKYREITVNYYHYFICFIIRAFHCLPYSLLEKGMRRRFNKGKFPVPSIAVANLGNLGRIDKLQNFGPARVAFFYPGARGMFLPGYLLSVFSFKSKFYISFFYNNALLTRQDAESLGSKLLAEMKRIAG